MQATILKSISGFLKGKYSLPLNHYYACSKTTEIQNTSLLSWKG